MGAREEVKEGKGGGRGGWEERERGWERYITTV